MRLSLNRKVVEGFGNEWSGFDQSGVSQKDQGSVFDVYFSMFP